MSEGVLPVRIRKILLAGLALGPVAAPASAETLREALIKAYKTNPTLEAQRANLRATDEGVPIARSSALPNISLQTNYAELFQNANNAFVVPQRALQSNGQATVPLYSGGQVKNSIKAAEDRVLAGRATLRGTEADLFTNTVGAYMDVIRDQAVVALNEQNIRVLEVNLQASRDRFQVGDLTRTDVAQSEARLSLAQSQLQQAQARLIASRETYIRVIGSPPGDLEPPPPLPGLPRDPDSAVQIALQDSPTLQAARKNVDATKYDVRVARAARLPQLGAFVNSGYFNYLGSLSSPFGANIPQSGINAQGGLQLTIPLYQGGQPAARIRQAQAREGVAQEQLTDSERGVVAQVRSAFAFYRGALEVIESATAAVNANKLSLEGVRAENGVGNRTVIEVLNAEQELLNSQVTLVTARRDAYVAGFAVLAAMGHAEAKDLGLDGDMPLYDPVINYRRVRNNISDWAGERSPKPVAPTTSNTPAQDAKVTRSPAAAGPGN
ncbi:TolC family outer membrane protein [Sphingomonas sp.]|uniref:TolC family outer membrane protein n=1 Tax=Sphingomonas sp. TaxID=28214 RepID=UPI001D3C6091|nr:TolC family outer membrane protein [Sphingomonas sp.]MBX9797439.1 TolC family outer membrane protein [Sphingomonas sp.]